jgi:Secretion system C-terminal sorting domain
MQILLPSIFVNSFKLYDAIMFKFIHIIAIFGLSTWLSGLTLAHQYIEPKTEHAVLTIGTKAAPFDESLLFSSERLSVSNAYPNPAIHFVSFRYTISDPEVKAKIIVRNVLGSMVAEYDLPPHQQSIKFETDTYVAGMYFYTLSVDDKNVVTKKFLVKQH